MVGHFFNSSDDGWDWFDFGFDLFLVVRFFLDDLMGLGG